MLDRVAMRDILPHPYEGHAPVSRSERTVAKRFLRARPETSRARCPLRSALWSRKVGRRPRVFPPWHMPHFDRFGKL